jgi:Icc-related predicted phosphoesterase
VKTRIFFASDVHGSESCFRKFINAAKFYDANALILGGDITGKALVPIVERPDGRFRLSFEGEEVVVKKEELPTYIKTLRNSGRYYFMATEAELAELEKDKAKLDALFLKTMKEVLRSWISLAQERLKGTGVKCYISPGNDDRLELDELLQDSENVFNPEAKVVELESGNEMITVGYANPTPWKSPREVPEDELFKMID